MPCVDARQEGASLKEAAGVCGVACCVRCVRFELKRLSEPTIPRSKAKPPPPPARAPGDQRRSLLARNEWTTGETPVQHGRVGPVAYEALDSGAVTPDDVQKASDLGTTCAGAVPLAPLPGPPWLGAELRLVVEHLQKSVCGRVDPCCRISINHQLPSGSRAKVSPVARPVRLRQY